MSGRVLEHLATKIKSQHIVPSDYSCPVGFFCSKTALPFSVNNFMQISYGGKRKSLCIFSRRFCKIDCIYFHTSGDATRYDQGAYEIAVNYDKYDRGLYYYVLSEIADGDLAQVRYTSSLSYDESTGYYTVGIGTSCAVQYASGIGQDYYNDFSDIGVLILISGVVLLPLILMRFSFNVVSFEDEDAHSVGVKSKFLRFYGIFAGGVLTATAMIHAGNVGMLATVVPLMCRYLYGADFRDLLWASALWGGVILLFSEFVRSYTYINEYQIPLGNIVSLLAVPLLIWVIRRQQKIFPSMER